MFEIEKKFFLKEKDEANVAANAEFLSEKVIEDIYYDTADFRLTTKDIWLRKRNGTFELKMPLANEPKFVRLTDQYEEIESEEIIRKNLNLPLTGDFEQVLAETGHQPFFQGRTIRRKYKKGRISVDIDSVESGDFYYSLAEIEILLEDKKEAAAAEKQIFDFAKELGLTVVLIRGKVVEYLKRTRPDHYRALVQNGVVEDRDFEAL